MPNGEICPSSERGPGDRLLELPADGATMGLPEVIASDDIEGEVSIHAVALRVALGPRK